MQSGAFCFLVAQAEAVIIRAVATMALRIVFIEFILYYFFKKATRLVFSFIILNRLVTDEQKHWANKILHEHELDMIERRVDFPPSRVDLKSLNGELWCVTGTENGQSSVARQASTLKLFKEAYKLSKKPNFECVISCEDVPRVFTKPAFFYATDPNPKISSYKTTFPDYCFDSPTFKGRYGFQGEGDDSYESLVQNIIIAGQTAPTTNKAGWAGLIKDNWLRIQLQQTYQNHSEIELVPVSWYEGSPWFDKNPSTNPWPKNFISYSDQVSRWRYLIDTRGLSWSDRVKFFYFSNRVILRINREYNEFYDSELVPWEHYVPVDNVEDLDKKLKIIKDDTELENKIKKQAFEFAVTKLSKQSVIQYIVNLINNTDWNELNQYYSFNQTCLTFTNLYNFNSSATNWKFEVVGADM